MQTLADILLIHGKDGKSIVFTQTKKDADDLMHAKEIQQSIDVIHGDIVQAAREKTLRRFREGQINVLVATDVAARGIDIPNVDLVV